jgi:hypothetical protein
LRQGSDAVCEFCHESRLRKKKLCTAHSVEWRTRVENPPLAAHTVNPAASDREGDRNDEKVKSLIPGNGRALEFRHRLRETPLAASLTVRDSLNAPRQNTC